MTVKYYVCNHCGNIIEKDKKEECPIPDYSVEYLEKYRETLMESVAETSEEFMDRYFGGEEFSVAEISAALAMNVGDGTIVPVCMGSPVNLQGVSNLLDDICGYFPDPSTRPCAGINLNTNEIFEANYDFAKPKSATIFKTIVDPFLGKYSMIKVCSGVIKIMFPKFLKSKCTKPHSCSFDTICLKTPNTMPRAKNKALSKVASLSWKTQ